MQQQAQAAQTALAAESQRRGVTGELAQSLQAALVSQQQAAAAAEQRVQADQRSLQLAREQEQAAQREAQLAKQRAHAEAAISQRLQNRVDVARAIVVHGKDSVEAKLAEEAVSRRLFELDLQRQGITGDMATQLRQQYENAVLLEGQIVQVQPAFQGIQSTVNGIAQCLGRIRRQRFPRFPRLHPQGVRSIQAAARPDDRHGSPQQAS